MLTGKLVRVRFHRDRIIPVYLDTAEPIWVETAERLLELFRAQQGRTRGELEEDISDAFGSDPSQLVHQGLAKLLEDRCEFEVVSGHPPDELRESVFVAAAQQRQQGGEFSRADILQAVAASLNSTPEVVDSGMFADLKSEQRLVSFKGITAPRLLDRYNVALAQAVLLRSTVVHVTLRRETPQRFRQLLRRAKFHRLVCEPRRGAGNSYEFHLDGPLSLFSATQKYGVQLALFLPHVLLCKDFALNAELLWGPQRKPKVFDVSAEDGLVSHAADQGMYVPPELAMFVELFRKKIEDWEISEEADVFPLGTGFWVPDYRLTQKATGKVVYLEVLGFWRRASAEKHLERLRQHAQQPFLLAVSDQLHIEDAELAAVPAGIHRFRQMPLPEEVARLAGEVVHV